MIVPKEHRFSVPFRGNRSAAIDVARTTLLAVGFEITAESEGELQAEGPGLRSTRQSPLLGASRYRFRVGSANIRVEALLGGVRNMKLFLFVFPAGLALLLMALFAILRMENWWVPALAVSPWVVISPLMAVMVQRRTTRAVDGLARSMARAAANR